MTTKALTTTITRKIQIRESRIRHARRAMWARVRFSAPCSTWSQAHPTYNVFLPAALAFTHLALAAAEILALAAALILRFFGFDCFVVFPLAFAQRALCAAAIFFLTAALILRLFFGEAATAALADEPKIRFSLSSSD